MLKLNRIRKELKQSRIVFALAGCISKDMTEIMVESLRNKMGELVGLEKQVRSSIVVLVEMMQNMLNNASYFSDVEPERYGIVMLSKEENSLIAYSSNLIANEKSAALAEKIKRVNGYDRQSLLEEFRRVRRLPLVEGAQGAGLGILEMAKVSDHPLDYHFEEYDGETDYFTLKVYLS